MKNNKVLAVIIIILLIVIVMLLVNSKKSDIAYNPQYPSPQNPSPTPSPSPTPTPSPIPNPTPQPCNTTSGGSFENQYNDFKCQYSLKYGTFSTALNAFKSATDPHMEVTQIAFYVPGKFPREDGNPYFIGRGTVSASANDCVVGYMNLITGVTESHYNACESSN